PEIRPPRPYPWNRWLHRRATDRILFSGGFMLAAHYEPWGLAARRTAVVHGAVDTEALAPDRWQAPAAALRRRLGIGVRTPCVGVVGRLSPVKGHAFILGTLAPLMQQRTELQVVVAGAEAQLRWADLAARVPPDLLPRVRYLGPVPDAPAVMAACDLLLVPSLGSEAVCRVAMEALALEVPVAGSAVHVIPEVIRDGATGWIVPAGDEDGWRDTIRRILDDPAEARRRAVRGGEDARARFSYASVGEALEELLRQGLAGADWPGREAPPASAGREPMRITT
ncbi:MAG: glycosyltransferase, partial [Candidatus Eisenbacteria bacterium]|nr:glycosyltransferase [Candidatus Eisenbacteria bacterium]